MHGIPEFLSDTGLHNDGIYVQIADRSSGAHYETLRGRISDSTLGAFITCKHPFGDPGVWNFDFMKTDIG